MERKNVRLTGISAGLNKYIMNKYEKLTALLNEGVVLLDGGTGSEFIKRGADVPSEILNFTSPQTVTAVASDYIRAGSRIIATNTFGVNRYKLENTGYTVADAVRNAIAAARKAVADTAGADKPVLVALDIGPCGKLLEPAGDLPAAEAYSVFKEIAVAGADADLCLIETMSDLAEIRQAVLAVKENTDLPIIASMSYEEDGRTFTGTSAAAAAVTLTALGVFAVGVNCGLGPQQMYGIVKTLCGYTHLPVMVKANAGLPDPVSGGYSMNGEEYAELARKFYGLDGVRLIGGCCGTSPDFISRLTPPATPYTPRRPQQYHVASFGRAVPLGQGIKIIGERINPTGKPAFKAALRDRNIDYILEQAIEQVKAGADILDVNVGLADTDERATMAEVVKALQGVTDLPLQIDSTKPDVIEAALRLYTGKAIVNSVNGEESILHSILPVVKKYGAAVIGLTLDDNGIPKTPEERFVIAKKIIETAESYGIAKQDIIIDCLTLTAATDTSAAEVTLQAVELVTNKLGVNTVLGVSNISFGLPERDNVNGAFLALAMQAGLNFAIMNPNSDVMSGIVRGFRMLRGILPDSVAIKPPVRAAGGEMSLIDAIASGLKREAARLTRDILPSMPAPAEIVDMHVIPALDKVGFEFEKKHIFLPQLIAAAEAATACFDIVKERIAADAEKSGKTKTENGEDSHKIIMATVKGDIHDIGKNIVKVMLESYGFTVVDLGKNVPPEEVVKAAAERGVKLVGLSALMTTTLPAMEETIRQLKEHLPQVKVMVGGAVLTQTYADKIGADWYSKDARRSVAIAKRFFEL